jgi:hypothetical protein
MGGGRQPASSRPPPLRSWRSVSLLENAIGALNLDPLRSLYYRALVLQHLRRDLGGPVGPYYEFGVGPGTSLVSYAHALRALCWVDRIAGAQYPIFAFDTFEGLPASSDARDVRPGWWPGRFGASEDIVRRRVLRALPKRFHGGLHLVPGKFEDTLTPQAREAMRPFPPAIINIDCDYYTSCKTVLDWIEPLLTTGAILYFDDVWEFWGHPDYGEVAAIREFERSGRGTLVPLAQVDFGGSAYVFVNPAKPLAYAHERDRGSSPARP